MFRLAHALLLLLISYQFIVQATNTPNVHFREEVVLDDRPKRTLFNIVWGCISTTIICAWAALHPNIPPYEGPLKGGLRRLELMLWTIICPEILPCWALNQRLAAMTVRDVYNEAKGYRQDGFWKTFKGWFSLYEIVGVNPVWTLKHGHFLIMGGIHLVEPAEPEGNSTSSETPTGKEQAVSNVANVEPRSPSVKADTEKGEDPSEIKAKPTEGRVTILTLEMLRVLVRDPEFEIQVTEAEITRTSKGDGLSKMIFILQSSWFILQCIARHVQGLGLTQLELTTLALASLNGITFILWWDKPLGAQTIVRVPMKRKLTDEERNVEGRGNSRRSELIRDIQKVFEWCLTTIRDTVLCRAKEVKWLIQLPLSILGLVLFPVVAFGMAFLWTIGDLAVGESTSFPVDATSVPTFYVPAYQSSGLHVLILVLFGTIFGGIHCAGWNLAFPTYSERKLWRVASLGVTVIPIGTLPLTGIVMLIVKIPLVIVRSNSYAHRNLGALVVTLSVFAYACARLILLGQALALLRHLPPNAFIAVDWSQFYPHFL